MDSKIAIKVDNVSKVFKLPNEKASSIKNLVVNFWRRDRAYTNLQVLENVSFEIKKGEFFGIVGRNGSGKSTLLKMMAGIYVPTKGNIQVNGKLTPFIELGVGFNPELTGRENIYLNGSLLGFKRSEMQIMYKEIVKFAELERFMDQKLKNYSSGMQVRLAFSIAIRVNTDILILDEVLAVGDEAFQKKCFSYFEELKRNKKTVVLVTHDMASVERYCSKAVFIEDGVIKTSGDPYRVAEAYSRSNEENYVPDQTVDKVKKEETKSDIKIKLLNKDRQPTKRFTYGDEMIVQLNWTKPSVQSAGVSIIRQSGEFIFGCNTYQDKWEMEKTNELNYEVKLNLGEGSYFIKAGIFGTTDKDIIDFVEKGPTFNINREHSENRWGGLTKLEYKWF
jgi:ABC-2 type transport system ATP-binding protein